jgi:hypothetical protein
MKTTLNKIREHNPCKESWEKLLNSLNKTKADDESIELKYILDLLGIEDAIWALRSIESDKDVRLFACDCAESGLHIFEERYPEDKRPRKSIETSRNYAIGKATIKELNAARVAARTAAWGAVFAAGAAARDAAWGAAWAARDAARDAAWGAVFAAGRAAWFAARDAAGRGAAWAARDAARDAEKQKQKELFIKYFCK